MLSQSGGDLTIRRGPHANLAIDKRVSNCKPQQTMLLTLGKPELGPRCVAGVDMGIIRYMLGLYRDNGKENGNYRGL